MGPKEKNARPSSSLRCADAATWLKALSAHSDPSRFRTQVKTKNKATKDFGKLFLAQELFIPPPGLSSSPVPSTSETSVPPTLPSQQQQDDDSEKSDDDSPLVDGDQTQQAAQAAPKSRKRAGSAKSSSGGAGKGRKKNAVWTIKFSDDGRYLAVGGKDGIVRGTLPSILSCPALLSLIPGSNAVWEALSTKEARQQTMSPESTIDPSSPVSLPPDTPSSPASTDFIRTPTTASFPPTPTTATADSAKGCTAGGAKKSRGSSGSERTPRVVMPVFSQKPLHEFRGHEADVLDLSWSKVRSGPAGATVRSRVGCAAKSVIHCSAEQLPTLVVNGQDCPLVACLKERMLVRFSGVLSVGAKRIDAAQWLTDSFSSSISISSPRSRFIQKMTAFSCPVRLTASCGYGT